MKRGSGAVHVDLDQAAELTSIGPEKLIALNEALERLCSVDPRAGRVVELRFFVGLSTEEVAVVTGLSEKTVKRDWAAAKAWLRAELRHQSL